MNSIKDANLESKFGDSREQAPPHEAREETAGAVSVKQVSLAKEQGDFSPEPVITGEGMLTFPQAEFLHSMKQGEQWHGFAVNQDAVRPDIGLDVEDKVMPVVAFSCPQCGNNGVMTLGAWFQRVRPRGPRAILCDRCFAIATQEHHRQAAQETAREPMPEATGPVGTPEQEQFKDVTGAAEIEQWRALSGEVGDDAAGVNYSLGLSSTMLIELATGCESGEWYFGNDELQASRLHVDAIRKALVCIEKRLRQDEADAALLSLSAEELGALIGVARTHQNMMKIQSPNAGETAEYALLQGAVQKLEAGQVQPSS